MEIFIHKNESPENFAMLFSFTKKLCYLLLALGALLNFSSCSVVSTDPGAFARQAKTDVKKGMSKAQVRQLLGRPVFISTDNKGIENWCYSKSNVGRGLVPFGAAGGESAAVSVSFSPNGSVIAVNSSTAAVPGWFQ